MTRKLVVAGVLSLAFFAGGYGVGTAVRSEPEPVKSEKPRLVEAAVLDASSHKVVGLTSAPKLPDLSLPEPEPQQPAESSSSSSTTSPSTETEPAPQPSSAPAPQPSTAPAPQPSSDPDPGDGGGGACC